MLPSICEAKPYIQQFSGSTLHTLIACTKSQNLTHMEASIYTLIWCSWASVPYYNVSIIHIHTVFGLYQIYDVIFLLCAIIFGVAIPLPHIHLYGITWNNNLYIEKPRTRTTLPFIFRWSYGYIVFGRVVVGLNRLHMVAS